MGHANNNTIRLLIVELIVNFIDLSFDKSHITFLTYYMQKCPVNDLGLTRCGLTLVYTRIIYPSAPLSVTAALCKNYLHGYISTRRGARPPDRFLM